MPESTRRRVERVVSSATAVRHSGAVDVAGVDVKEDQSSPWDSWEGEREADGTSLLCQLNAELTMLFAAAVEKIFEEEELELGETSDDSDERPRGREAVRKADVAAVGCHGQTVCHIPRIDESRGMPGYTRARLLHPVTDDRARTQDGTRRAHCSLWTWERWPRFSKCEVRLNFYRFWTS